MLEPLLTIRSEKKNGQRQGTLAILILFSVSRIIIEFPGSYYKFLRFTTVNNMPSGITLLFEMQIKLTLANKCEGVSLSLSIPLGILGGLYSS